MERGFKLYVLGSSAALPTSTRHTSALVLKHHDKYYLIDCGECAQLQIRRMGIPLSKIDHVFISHLHGDHYLGLPGLLFSLHLLGRQKELNVFGPANLQELIMVNFSLTGITPGYPIVFHTITRGREVVMENKNLMVETIEMFHRVPTFGFLFREKPLKRNIKKEAVSRYNIPIWQMEAIKGGCDLICDDNSVVPNHLITSKPPKQLSVAFCSDTLYNEANVQQLKGVDLLYHEATFTEEKSEIATEKFHSTAKQAAMLARLANARQLLLGHFSARYKDLQVFADEACQVFPNTLLATDGMVLEVKD